MVFNDLLKSIITFKSHTLNAGSVISLKIPSQ